MPRLFVAGEAIAFGTVDERHAIRHLLDRPRIAQVAHHRQVRLVGTRLAGTIHLRNRQHRTIAVQRQLLQRPYIPSHHLFLCLPLPAVATQKVQVVHDHQVAFPQAALQQHFRPYLLDGSPYRIVEIERQVLQPEGSLFQLSQLASGRLVDAQVIRVHVRHPCQHTVQHLQARHLQAEEADRFPGTRRVQGHL